MISRSSASGWTLCLLLVGGWIALRRDRAKQESKIRELDIGERSGLREEFIGEMAALREEVKGLREENSALRQEIRALHGIIDGMRRDQLQGAISTQSVVARNVDPSPEMQRALNSLDKVAGMKK